MNRPSFQFYTKDWRSNSKLRRCSPASRGVWVDILCALHDSDEYGVARYPLKELASEVGASIANVRELVEKGVLKGNDAELVEAFVYTPRSGRKDGEPVVLVPGQAGPIWYSSRMVKDEYVRLHRGESSRFDGGDGDSPKGRFGFAPKPPLSDGSTSASSSATAVLTPSASTDAVASAPSDRPVLELVPRAGPPPCPYERIVEAFHTAFPASPGVTKMTAKRKLHLGARWREEPKRQKLDWWIRLFAFIAESPFLMGQKPGRNGGPPFELKLDFLIRSEDSLVEVIEGKYHREQQA